MLFPDHLVVVRGGGDLGTGCVYRLRAAGFPVVVLERPEPLAIRRGVALASAVIDGRAVVESLTGRRAALSEAPALASTGVVPVVVSEDLPASLPRSVVVDARMAKRNLDTRVADAPLVVALGPGFTAGVDCHAVVETARGHHLGRVWWSGAALPDTGTPGVVGGRAAERVVRSPGVGYAAWVVAIGDHVTADQLLGRVGAVDVHAPFTGVVRGLISSSVVTHHGLKIADIDPRLDTDALLISDKALSVGGGVVEAVLTWMSATR